MSGIARWMAPAASSVSQTRRRISRRRGEAIAPRVVDSSSTHNILVITKIESSLVAVRLRLPITTEHTECAEPERWDFLGGLGDTTLVAPDRSARDLLVRTMSDISSDITTAAGPRAGRIQARARSVSRRGQHVAGRCPESRTPRRTSPCTWPAACSTWWDRFWAGRGYVRDRDAEFNRRGGTRAELHAELDRAVAVVRDVLPRLSETTLASAFPEPVLGVTFGTRVFLLHLCAHAAFHLGTGGLPAARAHRRSRDRADRFRWHRWERTAQERLLRPGPLIARVCAFTSSARRRRSRCGFRRG